MHSQALHYVSHPTIQVCKRMNANESSNMKFIYTVKLKYEVDYTIYLLPPAANINWYEQGITPPLEANFKKGGKFYVQKAPHKPHIHQLDEHTDF
jgi:hypothetical protein